MLDGSRRNYIQVHYDRACQQDDKYALRLHAVRVWGCVLPFELACGMLGCWDVGIFVLPLTSVSLWVTDVCSSELVSRSARGSTEWHTLGAKCIVQSAKCNVQSPKSNVQSPKCNVQSATCKVQRAKCKVQRPKCKVQRAKCKVQSAKCKVQSVKCKVQSVKCNVTLSTGY
jgi:hypothetical protein